ncbi:hypothetical protein JTE90_014658 [Oedothorax gibbosus]|uniref:Uncharacterized protein n=1 Tax=Oedothorax gibbosus TaxID=931172 RepID=A0AAV6V8E2_9ARAC|nr:hypothetical protein JTE90_014658 [Oedothorax gibbosus]
MVFISHSTSTHLGAVPIPTRLQRNRKVIKFRIWDARRPPLGIISVHPSPYTTAKKANPQQAPLAMTNQGIRHIKITPEA